MYIFQERRVSLSFFFHTQPFDRLIRETKIIRDFNIEANILSILIRSFPHEIIAEEKPTVKESFIPISRVDHEALCTRDKNTPSLLPIYPVTQKFSRCDRLIGKEWNPQHGNSKNKTRAHGKKSKRRMIRRNEREREGGGEEVTSRKSNESRLAAIRRFNRAILMNSSH